MSTRNEPIASAEEENNSNDNTATPTVNEQEMEPVAAPPAAEDAADNNNNDTTTTPGGGNNEPIDADDDDNNMNNNSAASGEIESPEKIEAQKQAEEKTRRLLRPLLHHRPIPEGKDQHPNAERDSNFFSKMFLWYTQQVLSVAGEKDDLMTADDLDLPYGGDSATRCYHDFEPRWAAEVTRAREADRQQNEKYEADKATAEEKWNAQQATAAKKPEEMTPEEIKDLQEEKSKSMPKKPEAIRGSLNLTLIKWLWPFVIYVTIAGAFSAVGPFTGIVLMRYIRDFVASTFTPNPDPDWHGLVYGGIWFGIQLIATIADGQIARSVARMTLRIDCSIRLLMIKKTMTLSALAMKKIGGQGVMVQHFTSDIQVIVQSFPGVWGQMATILRVIGAVIYLIYLAGWPALLPLVIFFIIVPINYRIINTFIEYFIKKQQAGDARTKKVMEALNSVRVIKFYAWERHFRRFIRDLREPELKQVFKLMGQLLKFMISLAIGNPLMQVALFIVMTYVDGKPDVVLFFQAIGIMGILHQAVTTIPQIYSAWSRMTTSMDRLAGVLDAEERDPKKYLIREDGIDTGDVIIKNEAEDDKKEEGEVSKAPETVESASAEAAGGDAAGPAPAVFAWPPELPPPIPAGLPKAIQEMIAAKIAAMPKGGPGKTLEVTDFHAKAGELVMVVGKVGSGKSSLCGALLSEMTIEKGSLFRKGKVAYVPQSAWILNATVRNNILLNVDYDEEWYTECLEAVDLTQDLKQLPNGDLTEVGEKGINLSGGQKQRLSLARALYQKADIYLFDDPLSALDAHVGRHVFEEAIQGILKDKTRILIANQLNYLPEATRVYVADGMKINEQDVPDGANLPPTPKSDEEKKAEPPLVTMMRAWQKTGQVGAQATARMETPGAKMRKPGSKSPLNKDKNKSALGKKDGEGALHSEEERNSGSVRTSTLTAYLNSFGGPLFWIPTVLFHILIVSGQIFGQLWMAFWQENKWPDFHTKYPTEFYLGIFAAALLFSALMTGIQQLHWRVGAVNAPRQLYDRMVSTVLTAPMEFFDTTPVGRIITRFTSDASALDFELPLQANLALVMTFGFLASMVSACYAIPWSSPVFVLAFIILNFIQPSVATVILRRLTSSTAGPVFNLYQEVLNGTASIRSMDIVEYSVSRFELYLDEKNAAQLATQVAFAHVRVRINTVMAFIAALVLVVILLTREQLDPTIVVFGIGNVGQVSLLLGAVLLQRGQLLMALNSIERMMDYTLLEPEPMGGPDALEKAGGEDCVPKTWPETGKIEFEHVSARYREKLPLVLKDVNFTIEGGHKVGVCGRTGSGKSTMLLTVFRIIPLLKGSVVRIDGIDTAEVPLEILRSRIAAIPQDPILFAGSVQQNLDPSPDLDEAALDRLREAIEMCHLKDILTDLAKRKMKAAEANKAPPGMGGGPPGGAGSPGAASPKANASASPKAGSASPKAAAATTPKPDAEDKKEETEEQQEETKEGSPKPDDSEEEKKPEEGTSTTATAGSPAAASPKPDEVPGAAEEGEEEELDLLACELGEGDLSVGQKQLLCLARAVSRRAMILVLDEATSSVDVHTDSLIQKTIRTVFKECTVITVAHRLNTIMDSDRIVVLDQGKVAEFGPPDHLLANEDSIFSGLYAEAQEEDGASPH